MLSLEAQHVVGSPTDLMVVETIWDICNAATTELFNSNDLWFYVHVAPLAAAMVEREWADSVELAVGRIVDELRWGRVWRTYDEDASDPSFLVGITDEVRYRTERRVLYWRQIEPFGIDVPAHIPNESAVARAALSDLHDRFPRRKAIFLNEVIEEVHQLMAYESRFWALHVVLNAIDAGALTLTPANKRERTTDGIFNCLHSRCAITDHWSATSS
jgi:hypothetical protein